MRQRGLEKTRFLRGAKRGARLARCLGGGDSAALCGGPFGPLARRGLQRESRFFGFCGHRPPRGAETTTKRKTSLGRDLRLFTVRGRRYRSRQGDAGPNGRRKGDPNGLPEKVFPQRISRS